MRKAPARLALAAGATIALLLTGAGSAHALADPVDLGTAEAFAVLAATTVTNTGLSVISGDIGLTPGTSVTGFPPGVQTDGAAYIAEGVAGQAYADANAAFVSASTQTGAPPPATAILPELGGLTLLPDLYQSAGVLQLTGNLTLDAQGDSTALFVIRSSSTFTTGASSSVTLINDANPCNIYWIVPSSATLGTDSTLSGTILAGVSVTATTGADVVGRLVALTGAVTLDTNTITSTGCAPVTLNPGSGIPISDASTPTAVTPVPLLAQGGPHDVLAATIAAIALLAGGSLLLLRRRRAV